MSTITISQLGTILAFTDETVMPVVGNVFGTLTTLKTDGNTVKTYVLGTLPADVDNIEANVVVLQGNVSVLQSNVAALGVANTVQSSLINTIQSNISALATVATSGDYNDLINTPVLSTVATSGDYNDLINPPVLGSVALSDDYNDLINTPVLGSVALSDDYNDLINTPNLAAISEFVMGNVTHWTSNVFTFSEAINQLAERVYNIENP